MAKRWSSEIPTTPGHYWVRGEGLPPRVYFCEARGDPLAILHHLAVDAEFMGPITPDDADDRERDEALAQACELAAYLESRTRGEMAAACRRLLSLPHARRVAARLLPEDGEVPEAMLERAMRARIPGGSEAWVWLFNCAGGAAPEERHRDWFRRVLSFGVFGRAVR